MASRTWRISLRGSGLIVASLLWSSSAWAQAYQRTAPATQPTKQQFHASGEYEGASGGVVKAVLDGKPWYLKPDKGAKVHLTGSATADFLAPGMFVKFKAEVDRKGKANAPVTDFVIFTPDPLNQVGATAAGNSFEEPGKKPAANATTAYDFAGRIVGVKKGVLSVNCGNMTAQVEAAPEATVKIDVQDASFASSGDKIDVKGWYQREGYGMVSDVTVELANTLTGPKKRTHGVAKPVDKTATTPDAKTDTAKPDAKGTAKPDPAKPDAAKPDATKPNAAKPDAAKPDAAKPDSAKPDPAKPDAPK
jgi:hypothetical protein